MLIRITAKHFCAGYDVSNGNIAPIIKYMKGWDFNKILNYCKSKNWCMEWLNEC
jgi:hypothetical protein